MYGKYLNRYLPLTLLLIAVISFATVALGKAAGTAVFFDLATSLPCTCSTEAVYTFYAENDAAVMITKAVIIIPAGYGINSAFLTTTPGIVVATGESGTLFPPTSGIPVVVKTTTTSGTFDIFVAGNLVTTQKIVPPTPTTPGDLGGLFYGLPGNHWSEASFVAGFFTNPCTPVTYTWGPNTATLQEDTTGVVVPVQARIGHTEQVTLGNCAVGGVVASTDKLSIATPYLALAGLITVVSAVVVVRRRSRD